MKTKCNCNNLQFCYLGYEKINRSRLWAGLMNMNCCDVRWVWAGKFMAVKLFILTGSPWKLWCLSSRTVGYFCSEFSTVSYVFNVPLPWLFRKCTTQCIYNDWKVELLINTENTPATFTTQRSRTLDNKIVILFIFRFHTHHILSFGLNKAKDSRINSVANLLPQGLRWATVGAPG